MNQVSFATRVSGLVVASIVWAAPALAQSEGEAAVNVSEPSGAAESSAAAEPLSNDTPSAADNASPPARKMDLSVEAPPPSRGRSGYAHDGFYLRAAVGPGWQWTSLNDRSTANFDVSGNGFSLGADILVGASPSPGIALGVGVLSNFGFDVGLEHDDTEVADTSVAYVIVGPFFDAFPDNKRGWHLGGEIGFAYAGLEDVNPALVTNAYGGGVAAWVGHDWWVAPEWSAGLNLRLAGAYLFGSRNDEDARVTNLSTTLLVSVLYN